MHEAANIRNLKLQAHWLHSFRCPPESNPFSKFHFLLYSLLEGKGQLRWVKILFHQFSLLKYIILISTIIHSKLTSREYGIMWFASTQSQMPKFRSNNLSWAIQKRQCDGVLFNWQNCMLFSVYNGLEHAGGKLKHPRDRKQAKERSPVLWGGQTMGQGKNHKSSTVRFRNYLCFASK